MNFFEALEKLKRTEASLIVFSLLDRIPIIVFGNDSHNIDAFLIDVSELLHFRKEFVFYTDFISLSEYHDLIQNESIDYNSQRAHIRCPCNVALKALNHFENFDSWIIGIEIPNQKDKLNYFKKSIKKKIKSFLSISLLSDSIVVELEGINWKQLDLTLEQNLLQKISQDTEKSVAKMKRVLSEKIKLNDFDEDLIKALLDFDVEKEELKKNIIKKEIQNFYSGSKRAFFIFSRLNLLNNIESNTKMGSKTLLETIDYVDAPIERIISFINKEWGEDFKNLIENGKKVNALDSMQSLWG
ncbi:MAG: hypothetical protein ACFE85_14455 [Candidatus Hodarchaeota archaeon]